MAQAKETDNSSNNKQLIKKRKKLLLSKEKEVMGKECSNYCLGVVTHPYIYPCIRMKVVGWGGECVWLDRGRKLLRLSPIIVCEWGVVGPPSSPTLCASPSAYTQPHRIHPSRPLHPRIHSSIPLHINMSPVSFCFHPSRACSSK